MQTSNPQAPNVTTDGPNNTDAAAHNSAATTTSASTAASHVQGANTTEFALDQDAQANTDATVISQSQLSTTTNNPLKMATPAANPSNNTDAPVSSPTAASTDQIALPSTVVSGLTDLLKDHLQERRRALRWKYAFRWGILGLVAIAFIWPMLIGSSNTSATEKHIALIKLEGTIEIGSPAGAEPINTALQAAFEDAASVAIVLQMNSPGGSPVQSAMIYDEINRLRNKYNKPLYAVVEEVCASGCYYVAAAADDIYVNPSSLVGSIGVLMDGFGATELMKKVGVERRLYTAGENKGMLDPFSPTSDKQKNMIKEMLNDVHTSFIEAVREGRADRLKEAPDVFSGRIFTGRSALKIGLADDIGSVASIARDVIEVENIVDYSPHENIAERVAKKLGASFGAGAMQSLFKSSYLGNIR